MPEGKVPYVAAYGNITKALEAIQKAQTPERFTQDFLSTKLGLKGGSARPVIPFLKKAGFLASDGSPTDLYKRFRNQTQASSAAHQALHKGFASLYEVNEYAHDLGDNELKGIIVQVTGIDGESSTIKSIVGSFKALKAFIKDGHIPEDTPVFDQHKPQEDPPPPQDARTISGLNLGYTINLHLPATSDIAVYNAIFKSLREHVIG